LQSHYLFAAKFGRPGKGNDKAYASHCTSCVFCGSVNRNETHGLKV
jgi:hypothetical protein